MLHFESRTIQPGTGHEAGRALLKEMVENYTGKPMPPIEKAPRGKPYFTDNSLHFSISHTKHHVFCVLSHHPVGIDAEEQTRKISPKLSEKILSAEEYVQYRSALDPHAALLTFWVLKEAQAKCSGHGLAGYPNHTNFRLDDPRAFIADGCHVAIIEEDSHAL